MPADTTLAAEEGSAGTPEVPSTSTSRQCEVCEKMVSKYTCPRCGTKICSLECTKNHKIRASCSGVREKSEFVPMNSYNDVAMWRDLAFLREVGDKVKDWGGALNLPSQEAVNRKERQLAGNRKGKQREDNGKTAVVHDRLKSLSKRELALRRSLMQNGIEILFLPKEMERHKANRTSYNLQKKKLALTASVHNIGADKKRVSSKIMHDNSLETKILDVVKKAFPSFDTAQHIVLLPVPVRPVIFSKNAPFPEVKKLDLPLLPTTMQIQKVRPLPKAHSSLPMKPSWLADAPAMPAAVKEPTPEPEVPAPPKRELSRAGPREVWLVDVKDSFKDALKGTSILEWPEFEIWPEELAREEVEAERLEYAERRQALDRDDWKRKREAVEEDREDSPDIKKMELQDSDDSDDSSSESDTSSSSSSSEGETKPEEDVNGDAITVPIPTVVAPQAAAISPASHAVLRGFASLPAKPPSQL